MPEIWSSDRPMAAALLRDAAKCCARANEWLRRRQQPRATGGSRRESRPESRHTGHHSASPRQSTAAWKYANARSAGVSASISLRCVPFGVPLLQSRVCPMNPQLARRIGRFVTADSHDIASSKEANKETTQGNSRLNWKSCSLLSETGTHTQ